MSIEPHRPQPAVAPQPVRRAARHLRVWLACAGLAYSASAREAFAAAHPTLFGRGQRVTLRGYAGWLVHDANPDSVEAFAHYLATGHDRWLAEHDSRPALAPCLIGRGTTRTPCWMTHERAA